MKEPASVVPIVLLLLCTACARGADAPADSAAKVPAASSQTPGSPETEPDAARPDNPGEGSLAPEMGTIHQVHMIGDAQGFRFEPADVEIVRGDAIRFTVVAGGPHNVVFDGASMQSDIQTRLDQQISDRMAPLASAMLSEIGEAVTISFAGMPPGRYPFSCATHASAGMKGTINVQ